MRQLSEQELEWIHARLKSLHIRYSEVYEEIFDHYCTTLENAPALDSPTTITKLNETFAWSVVKGMDKELEKNVSKQVWAAQLEFLKFWNHGVKGFLIGCGFILTLSILIATIPSAELVFIPFTAIFIVAILIYYIKGYGLSFTLKHKSVSVLSATIFKRISIFGNIFIWIYYLPQLLMDEATLTQYPYTFTVAITALVSTLYSASLFVIATNLPNTSTIK